MAITWKSAIRSRGSGLRQGIGVGVRRILAQGALLTLTLHAACGDTSNEEDGGQSGFVACEEAKTGDPCDVPGKGCGEECYGCYAYCDEGVWSVNCAEEPTCETVTIAQGEPCPGGYCLQLECGPFEMDTACGDAAVTAKCSEFGWFYELPCDPDCESLDEAGCSATAGCAWAVPCNDLRDWPPQPPRCIDFPPLVGDCDGVECPAGEYCVEVGLNQDVTSGDCSGGGAVIAWCVAE